MATVDMPVFRYHIVPRSSGLYFDLVLTYNALQSPLRYLRAASCKRLSELFLLLPSIQCLEYLDLHGEHKLAIPICTPAEAMRHQLLKHLSTQVFKTMS